MSRKDMIFYDMPKLAVMIKGAGILKLGSRQKLIGEYLSSDNSKLAIIENFSYLLSFDDIEIKGDWADKSKQLDNFDE